MGYLFGVFSRFLISLPDTIDGMKNPIEKPFLGGGELMGGEITCPFCGHQFSRSFIGETFEEITGSKEIGDVRCPRCGIIINR